MLRLVAVPFVALGIAGCMPDGGYYDGAPPRAGYYGSPGGSYGAPGSYGSSSGYYPRSSRWDDGNQCTFRTRRGSVAGYVPQGKNRCCIDTRSGPSCQ